MAVYFTNIPASTEDPSVSQPKLQSNSVALFDAQNRNHISLLDAGNSGRHVVIEMKEQTGNPTPISTYASLFIKDDSGTQNLYMIDESSVVTQFTNAFTAAAFGHATLPGGLTFKWGRITAIASGSTVTFDEPSATPVPFANACFNVQLTTMNVSNANRTTQISRTGTSPDITKNGFKFYSDETTAKINFMYFAVGN